MLNSVRIRLTLWYTAILGLVLGVFATSVYAVVSHGLYRELDGTLRSTADVIAMSLQHEIQEHKGRAPGEAMFTAVLATIHAASFPRQAISVFSDGKLVARKAGVGGTIDSEPADGLLTTVRQRRMISRSLNVSDLRYRIAVSEPVDRTRSELAEFRGVLLIAVPCALVLAAGAGYLLARKSLAPVVAMSEQVNRITAGKLGERLTVINSRDELGQLAQTFNGLLHRLDEAFEQQRRFMADASHELRTPISISRTAADVTLNAPLRSPDEYRDALSIVAAQMQRLTRVVNDMFTLARADSGAYAVQRSRFYLNDVIEEALEAARLLASHKSIHVSGGPFEESAYEGDEDLVRQLLLILLDNAIKYTPDGGCVEVGLEPGYAVTVADTGIGIPTEARDRIFDRFYRVDKARSRSSATSSGGAGLGLAIARWIAGVHGGSVNVVSSSPGQGSVMRVLLPLRP